MLTLKDRLVFKYPVQASEPIWKYTTRTITLSPDTILKQSA